MFAATLRAACKHQLLHAFDLECGGAGAESQLQPVTGLLKRDLDLLSRISCEARAPLPLFAYFLVVKKYVPGRGMSGNLDPAQTLDYKHFLRRAVGSASPQHRVGRLLEGYATTPVAKALSFSKTQNLPSGYASTVLKRYEFSW